MCKRLYNMSGTHQHGGSMQDGRFAQEYKSSCVRNSSLQSKAGVPSWDNAGYREYLSKNGLGEMQMEVETYPCGSLPCADLGAAIRAPESVTITEQVMPYEHTSTVPRFAPL